MLRLWVYGVATVASLALLFAFGFAMILTAAVLALDASGV